MGKRILHKGTKLTKKGISKHGCNRFARIRNGSNHSFLTQVTEKRGINAPQQRPRATDVACKLEGLAGSAGCAG